MNTYPPLPNNKFTSGHIKVSVYYNTIDRIDRIRTIDRISTIDLFLRYIIRPEKELEVRYIKNGRSRSIRYDLEEWGFHSKDPRVNCNLSEKLANLSGQYNIYSV